MSFWDTLPKPIIVLAPLADVTDAPFRRMIAKYSRHLRADGTFGGPDVMWTEFVSADGLVRATEEGKKKLMADLLYSEGERPIVAQLFSSNEDCMEQAAGLCAELGFDGVDINMGCPDRGIERQGCGAAMIRNPNQARRMIRAAKRGAGVLPVSVKTRLGYHRDDLEEWLPALLEETPAAITIHARTRQEMSKVPARWERVQRAVVLRNETRSTTRILGNGDVSSLDDAQAKISQSGADGAMIGRAIFGNPWLFNSSRVVEGVSHAEKLAVLVEHSLLFKELLPHKNFSIMKKHYRAYVEGFPGAKELRQTLMEAADAFEVKEIVNRFQKDTVPLQLESDTIQA